MSEWFWVLLAIIIGVYGFHALVVTFNKFMQRKVDRLRQEIKLPDDRPPLVWWTAEDAYQDDAGTVPAGVGDPVRTIRNRVDGSLIKVNGTAEVRKTPPRE